MSVLLPLTKLPRALKQETGEQISYRRLYILAIDGAIPAVQASNGRWAFDPADLPAIAREERKRRFRTPTFPRAA